MSGPKITYVDGVCRDGVTPYRTKAYLDHDEAINGLHYGVNKHTDEPVIVRWSDERERWEKVCDFIGPMPRHLAYWLGYAL